MFTKEEKDRMRQELLASFRPQPPPPKPTPAMKAEERFVETKQPTVAVIDAATRGNDALARRMEAERKELAQENLRARYQRELDRWWQSKLDAEAVLDDDYVYVGGFRERRYKTTCHRGKGDPDYGM
jgi:hypothetical protein